MLPLQFGPGKALGESEALGFGRTLVKLLRIIAGLLLVGFLLRAATLATRDCTVGIYAYDICLWVWLREHLGLPASKVLRAGALELAGLAIAAGLYLTLRYVFPLWSKPSANPNDPDAE
jgi:hypothetical protein